MRVECWVICWGRPKFGVHARLPKSYHSKRRMTSSSVKKSIRTRTGRPLIISNHPDYPPMTIVALHLWKYMGNNKPQQGSCPRPCVFLDVLFCSRSSDRLTTKSSRLTAEPSRSAAEPSRPAVPSPSAKVSRDKK